MQEQPRAIKDSIDRGTAFADGQLRRLITAHPNYFPIYTTGGRWRHPGERWTNWCEGFLGGMMWILQGLTGEQYWAERARHYSKLIEARQNDRTVHDLGFLFWPTWKRWYDADGDPGLNKIVVTAGQTMGMRYVEKGRYLHSFIGAQSLFIDIMMNMGIVFYAAQESSDEDLNKKAIAHCDTTRRFLVRGDGSTAHEGLFDLETGEFLRQSTQQGWRSDSTWARGLAWSLYGFSTVYSMTHQVRFLETAQACAQHYLEHTSFNPGAVDGPGIPPNDFAAPSEAEPCDSSAAAIAASGLLTLSGLVRDPLQADRYRSAAISTLLTLSGPRYLAASVPGWEGILLHGVYHVPKQIGVDESVMWGDYFYLEGIEKLSRLQQGRDR
jgi:unsaturated chondroitin disaccharide hydrolase